MMPAPKCRELLGSLSDYLDGVLEEHLCRELERHLSDCEDCRVMVDTLKKTIYLYHAGSEAGVPVDVRERLFKRLELDEFITRLP